LIQIYCSINQYFLKSIKTQIYIKIKYSIYNISLYEQINFEFFFLKLIIKLILKKFNLFLLILKNKYSDKLNFFLTYL
jgi:hypothetical protein